MALNEIQFEKIECETGEITERKLNKCVIEFENNSAKVYYSGQLLCGTVQLSLNEKKDVRGVFLKIVGKAYVRWTEGYGQHRTVYKGKELFLDKQIYLIGGSDDKLQLAGSYKYIFQYKLPNLLPSSLECKYAYIRYNVYVCFDTYLWSNEEFDNSFTVIQVSDLTPSAHEPAISRSRKGFSQICFLGCVTSEPLEIVAQMLKCGYIPRETIDLHLQVRNKSNQPVLELRVQLIQKIKYFTHAKSSPKKTEEIVLNQEYVEGCDWGQERDFHVAIVVPAVPPNQNEICNIIKIKYFIRILVSVPCCHTDPELYLPITIGSNAIEDSPLLPPWINPFANDFK